jgi:aspartate-semialdehyde dehydrogenase
MRSIIIIIDSWRKRVATPATYHGRAEVSTTPHPAELVLLFDRCRRLCYDAAGNPGIDLSFHAQPERRSSMRTAILGASGLVGRNMLRLLEECPWADSEPLLLTSERSAGTKLPFRGREVVCRDAASSSFAEIGVALFSAGAAASLRYAPMATQEGCWVVDNSSAFRMDPAVPLIVPEINPALVPVLGAARGGRGGIIANPNCSTIQIALAVAPLQKSFGLQEVHVTTLQAVSGAGRRAVAELSLEIAGAAGRGDERILAGDPNAVAPAAADRVESGGRVFPRRIAFNAVPEIGAAMPDGSFQEESKVREELRKILALDDLSVTCTATRVPVWNGHSAAVRVILGTAATPRQAAAAMAAWPGLEVAAEPHAYATPAEISGCVVVHVGRLRQDPQREDALLFWVVADNLLKGAAANAVQIAELLAGAARAAR